MSYGELCDYQSCRRYAVNQEKAGEHRCAEHAGRVCEGCAEFYCGDCAGKPSKLQDPLCERCEGTGVMKVYHFDADNNITGQHEMYCPDGCKEPNAK